MGIGGGARDLKMVGSTAGHWKRPVNRMYAYNYQVGENYYMHMTDYIDKKVETKSDLPGPLCFSERIAVNALNDVKKDIDYKCRETKIISVVKSSTVGI